MNKVTFALLTAIFILIVNAALATTTFYGPTGHVTVPSAETSGAIVIEPYLMTYGGSTTQGGIVGNIGIIPNVEVYGSTTFEIDKSLSFDNITTYGAKLKLPVKIKDDIDLAIGATAANDDSIDFYATISKSFFDIKVAKALVSGGLGYNTQKNSAADNSINLYAGASVRVMRFLDLSADYMLPLNNGGEGRYYAGVSTSLLPVSVRAGITNDKSRGNSKDFGYYLSIGAPLTYSLPIK